MIQNIARTFTEQLVIDDNEVHITKGVISRYTHDIPYSWIVSVEVSQTIFERVFGIGTLEIQTVKNVSGVHFSGIDNPDMIGRLIHKRMTNASVKV